jgi:hypothetical protein
LKAFLAIVVSCFCLTSLQAEDERIFVNARINGQPVRLAYDTGVSVPLILLSTAAQRLHLKVNPPPAGALIGPGEAPVGWTDQERLDFDDFGFTNIETSVAIGEVPPGVKPNVDGMVGWPALSNNVFSVNFVTHTLTLFTNETQSFADWLPCRIQTNLDLVLALPTRDHSKPIIALDSGSAYGVALSPKKWIAWQHAHANQPMTMEAYFTPGAGLVVTKEGWADKISLGNLELNQVPVMAADSSAVALHASPHIQYQATLGFAALKRLDVIIDGKQGMVYLRPKPSPPLPYDHNRLGAVFVPADSHSDDLLAHVAAQSPAAEAGIRNGDTLLKIGPLDCTHWRTDPSIFPLSRFWDSPAGTKLEFTLNRDGKIFQATATLRNILPPGPVSLITQ